MSHLIEIQPATRELPGELAVAVGDVLRVSASGGQVTAGTAVRIIGIFTPALIGLDGQPISPAGAPNTVLFEAVSPGRAEIDVFTGDPSRAPVRHSTAVVVAPE